VRASAVGVTDAAALIPVFVAVPDPAVLLAPVPAIPVALVLVSIPAVLFLPVRTLPDVVTNGAVPDLFVLVVPLAAFLSITAVPVVAVILVDSDPAVLVSTLLEVSVVFLVVLSVPDVVTDGAAILLGLVVPGRCDGVGIAVARNVEFDVRLYDVADLTSPIHVAGDDRLTRCCDTPPRFTSDVSIDSADPSQYAVPACLAGGSGVEEPDVLPLPLRLAVTIGLVWADDFPPGERESSAADNVEGLVFDPISFSLLNIEAWCRPGSA